MPVGHAVVHHPKLTRQGFKTTYRVIANDLQQGNAMARFAVDVLKAERIAVIDDRTAYGQGLADALVDSLKAARREAGGA